MCSVWNRISPTSMENSSVHGEIWAFQVLTGESNTPRGCYGILHLQIYEVEVPCLILRPTYNRCSPNNFLHPLHCTHTKTFGFKDLFQLEKSYYFFFNHPRSFWLQTVITTLVPCYLGSCTLEVNCICWEAWSICVMLHGLICNWEIAAISIGRIGRAGIRGLICFSLETDARVTLCVIIMLSLTEHSASKVHWE